jgi:hypothetical protein
MERIEVCRSYQREFKHYFLATKKDFIYSTYFIMMAMVEDDLVAVFLVIEDKLNGTGVLTMQERFQGFFLLIGLCLNQNLE